MEEFGLLVAITFLLVLLGTVEALVHRRNLSRIPIRIHVNGTRGKSSVTRLIAAGLREGGFITCAKTTGTLPRMILPDGSEYPVFRPSSANVIEQLRIIRTAVAYNTQALVVECMALQPFLQWLSESRMIRGTHGVITNARADHLEVMGPMDHDVALALAGTVPSNGKLFTTERRHFSVLQAAARDRGTELISVDEDEIADVTDDEMARFPYVEHKENVALSLRVCQDLGIPREIALRGMWQVRPDPGVMTTHELDFFGRYIFFVNGFAANDPESTERLWNLAIKGFPDVEKRIAIFNCRADRPERSWQLGRACVRWQPADHYVLVGTGTYFFARAALAAGLNPRRIVHAEGKRVDEIFETVIELAGKSALAMGMGNIGGIGLDLVRHFRNRSIPKETGWLGSSPFPLASGSR